MITKFPKMALIIVFAIVVTIFWAGTALAETPDGMGPDSAMGPGDWITMQAGDAHWFVFHFDYDGTPEKVEINLYADPENGATFTVRTEEQARLWRRDGTDEWFGAGSENKYAKGDISWANEFTSSGTYYVVVEHNALTPGPAACKLEITGKGVSFPMMAAEPVAAPVVMAPEEVAMAAPVMQIGTGPDEATAPMTGQWLSLDAGVTHWFAFNYDFDEGNEPIEIKVFSNPEKGAVLTVRNQEQAQLWRGEGKSEHFGCCTVETISGDETDYAVWLGRPGSSGTYYIVVEKAKNVEGPILYNFTIEGEGVYFPTVKMAPPVEAAPAPEAVLPAAPAAPAMQIGAGPNEAMAPMTGKWIPLEAGVTHWFAFNYDFDSGNEPIEIKVFSNPEKSAVLTVRNQEQARLWITEGKSEHFGCCTVETISGDETDYGVWLGRPGSSGKYYIVVETAEGVDGPILYNFTIAGEGVH
jgi:hypothetical protein